MAACVYQETRLNLDAATSHSTVDILLPAHNATAFASRLSPKRRRLNNSTLTYDEESFQKTQLASEASIYFRPTQQNAKKSNAPRAILWRILEERTTLELQAVDLWQDDDSREPELTLRITFPEAIRPNGIALAERDNQDSPAAVAFVLTTSGDLYTLDLRREIFIRADIAIDGPKSWCDRSSGGTLSSRGAFKLFAKSANELWASLGDGSLVRLDRKQGLDGSKWRETFYSERDWKTSVRGLGGLIAWKGHATARYGDMDLQPSTAIAMALSPDGRHMWTTCLDHTLKAWDIASGKLSFNADLAGDSSRDLQRPVDHLLNPQHSQLLRLVPSRQPGEYTVVAFSPNSRQFKFWDIRDLESPEHGIQDLRPDAKLVPPIEELTGTVVWNLENFHIRPPQVSNGSWSLWILVRSGARCSTFNLSFNLEEHADRLAKTWRSNWQSVHSGSNTVDELRHNLGIPDEVETTGDDQESEDVVEHWCDFLFYPGRFTVPTLETALTVFLGSLGRGTSVLQLSGSNSTKSLKERLCEAIGLSAQLHQLSDGVPAYDRYTQEIGAQWRTFYGVVKDLHKRRGEPLALAFDADLDAPWLVTTDQIAPLRSASECEILWLNREGYSQIGGIIVDHPLLQPLADARTSELGQLFHAVDVFRQSLSPYFVRHFASVLESEITMNLETNDGSVELTTDLQAVYEKSGFAGQVSDDDYNTLTDALEPLSGLSNLENDIFKGVLDFLDEAPHGQPQNRQPTRYGARALIRGAQETLELGSTILLDLLLLVVFMGAELEEGDLLEDFDAPSVFGALLGRAKEYNLLNWLASTMRQEGSDSAQQSPSPDSTEVSIVDGKDKGSAKAAVTNPLTTLESMILGDWSALPTPSTNGSPSQPNLLGYWSRAWTFGMRLSKQYTQITTHVMATLVKHSDVALASQFMKFMPVTPWASYLRARSCLAQGNFASAAVFFKSAGDLATGRYFDAEQQDSASLLDLDERDHLNDGLARYYQHVVSLFEKAHSMSYVVEFAELGLEASEQEGNEHPLLENELLSRQIEAMLTTSRFEAACEALNDLTDFTLRTNYTKMLLTSIFALPAPSILRLLLTIPFPDPTEIDAYISTCTEKVSPLNLLPTFTTPTTRPDSALSMSSSTLFTTTKKPPPQPPYHKLLSAYRLHNNDIRGAAATIWDRLQLLLRARDTGVSPKPQTQQPIKRKAGSFAVPSPGHDSDDEDEAIDSATAALDEDISHTYLVLINTLNLLPADDAWLLCRPLPPLAKTIVAGKVGANREAKAGAEAADKAPARMKRRVVQLGEVRRKWQEELDRRADLRAGRFAAFELWEGNGDEAGEADGT